jgi:hypothetical protein
MSETRTKGAPAPSSRTDTRSSSETKKPARGAAHEQLDVFVGRWKTQGQSYGPDAPMVGDESYEWLPGEFFLAVRFDRRVGDGEHRGLGVMGYDESRQVHFATMYDNLGFARTSDLRVRGRVWTFDGPWERANYAFSEDGRTITIHWERTFDGANWQPLCDLKATKV